MAKTKFAQNSLEMVVSMIWVPQTLKQQVGFKIEIQPKVLGSECSNFKYFLDFFYLKALSEENCNLQVKLKYSESARGLNIQMSNYFISFGEFLLYFWEIHHSLLIVNVSIICKVLPVFIFDSIIGTCIFHVHPIPSHVVIYFQTRLWHCFLYKNVYVIAL